MPLAPPTPAWDPAPPVITKGRGLPAVLAAGGQAASTAGVNKIDATQPWPAGQPVAVPPVAGGLALIAKLKKMRSLPALLISVTGKHPSPIKLNLLVRPPSGGRDVFCDNPPAASNAS